MRRISAAVNKKVDPHSGDVTMKIMIVIVLSLLLISPAHSEEPKEPAKAAKEEMRARIAAYLENGKSGVFYSDEKDVKDAKILRVFIVGTSTISTTLGAEEGLEIAEERAGESAKSEYVKWLGSKVAIRKTVKNEILLTKESTDGEKGGEGQESAKRVERRTKEFEETASHLVRGLRVVGVQQIAKEKKYIVVYRWDSAPGVAIPEPKKPMGGKLIQDKKVIIDD